MDTHFAQMKALAHALWEADGFAYERLVGRHPIVEQARLRDLRERIRVIDVFVEWHMILSAMEALNAALAPDSPPTG